MAAQSTMLDDAVATNAVQLQTRRVPVDLLFVPIEQTTTANQPTDQAPETPGSSLLLPLVALHAESEQANAADWWARLGELCGLTVGTPPVVTGLDRDRLVLGAGVDAARRAKARDKRWIKVQMTDEARRLWDSRPTDRLKSVVREQRRKEFYNPVYHEDFRKAKTCRPESVRLDRVRRVLGTAGNGLTGLDIGCNMGYMTHAFERQGFQMTAIDFDTEHLAIAHALSEMYRLAPNFVCCQFRDFEPEQPFDVTIALSSLYHMFFNQELDRPETVAERVGRLTRHALFWESGDQPEREIDLIRRNTKLTEYYSLGATEGTGKARRLGVFLCPNTSVSRPLAANYRHKFGGRDQHG